MGKNPGRCIEKCSLGYKQDFSSIEDFEGFVIHVNNLASSSVRFSILFLLSVCTASYVVILRLSRTYDGSPYVGSTAIFLGEALKIPVSLTALLIQKGTKDITIVHV